jgi:hypothetical protein
MRMPWQMISRHFDPCIAVQPELHKIDWRYFWQIYSRHCSPGASHTFGKDMRFEALLSSEFANPA